MVSKRHYKYSVFLTMIQCPPPHPLLEIVCFFLLPKPPFSLLSIEYYRERSNINNRQLPAGPAQKMGKRTYFERGKSRQTSYNSLLYYKHLNIQKREGRMRASRLQDSRAELVRRVDLWTEPENILGPVGGIRPNSYLMRISGRKSISDPDFCYSLLSDLSSNSALESA